MENLLYFDKDTKEVKFYIVLCYSIFFHILLVILINFLTPNPVDITDLRVTTNTVQISSKTPNSNKQSLLKHRDKVQPTKEFVKSIGKPSPAPKEIPAEKVSTAQKMQEAVTPSGQSTNDSKEFFSAESTVDKTAQCTLPEINITDDAANAGITSGSVIIEVQINSVGKVIEAKLIKGTGYKIDQVALAAAKELDCKPAWREKHSVGVIKRITWMIVP
ncbi:energy transducer TonB [Fluviispira multicolorata]|uniref:TonB family protein n=1 Tax=Fluviispira multicolorata TaxID=2654512 RepID=A0A833N302_9BACT|nr:TonB family protein [Fluviispira multicolorata]KAB8033413.1 TonB family protein [Fluviispira multicolorata]